jgi:plastocyanin
MILRWLICFSVLAMAPARAADVMGSVELMHSQDSGAKKRNFAGVVVALVPLTATHFAAPAHHYRMLQKDKSFKPHVLAVQVNGIVDFPNADPIFHNAFSSYSGQVFDVGLYPPGTSKPVRFDRPGVVRVFCNIHQFMSAVIVVVNSPYFGTTDQRGNFNVAAPPGDYQLQVFHERASDATLRALSRQVHVGEENIALPVLQISESGYLPAPHKNKHGQDYAPAANDRAVYPGVRN